MKIFLRGQERSEIDSILSPVFETVRNNKINSFVQLKNWQQDGAETSSYIFQPQKVPLPKTSQIASKTHSLGFSIKSTGKQDERLPKTAKSIRRSNPEEINNFIVSFYHKKEQSDDSLERRQKVANEESKNRIKRINSKMKRHLVDRVDFQEIEKKLFQKRECMTRYQYFMELKSKQKLTQSVAKSSGVKITKNKSTLHGLELQTPKQYQTVSLRTTPKKKFWITNQSKRYSNAPLSETMNFVEGKAMRTIQN